MGRITSSDLLSVLLGLMKPGMLFAFTSRSHIQLGVCQVLLCKAAFQPVVPQPVLVHGAIPPHVQDFALPFIHLNKVPDSPLLQTLKVPLNVSTTIWSINCSSQFCIICKPVFIDCPTIYVNNEDIK